MSYFKRTFIATVLSISMLVPLVSFAETDNSALIAQLLAQIKSLTAQVQMLRAQQSDSTQWCHMFNTNLRVGGQNNDIAALHKILGLENISGPNPTHPDSENFRDTFEEDTASMVTGFQEKYKDEILTPNGLKYGTGYVGVATRRKLNQLYGCGKIEILHDNHAPAISGVSGPTVLQVGEQGTWTVNASDPDNQSLSYRVVWGDESSASAVPGGMSSQSPTVQAATFTHSYSQAGYYNPTFFVTEVNYGADTAGKTAKTSISVHVGGYVTKQTMRVLSPNGGETWTKGSTQTIQWQDNTPLPLYACPIGGTGDSCFSRKYDIKLVSYYPPCSGDVCPMIMPYQSSYTINRGVAGSSFSWTVGIVQEMSASDLPMAPLAPDGAYTIQVCQSGAKEVCDQSDSYFKIISNQTRPSITVTSPNGGEMWKIGSFQEIKWMSNNLPGGQNTTIANLVDLTGHYVTDNWVSYTDVMKLNVPSVPVGQYKIRLCASGIASIEVGVPEFCDSSDAPFSIVTATTTTSAVSSESLTASALDSIKAALDAIQKIINQM